jgi:chaperonin cofactor prefoldin
MSKQDDQLWDKLQRIETQISSESEELSRVLAQIQENWNDPGAALVIDSLNKQMHILEEQASALRKKAASLAGNQEET